MEAQQILLMQKNLNPTVYGCFRPSTFPELKFTGFIADSATVGRINNGGRVKNETRNH